MNEPRGFHRGRAAADDAASPAASLATAAMDVVPFNARHLDEARDHWAVADWKALGRLDSEVLQAHPDRARLAVIRAAGCLQTGDRRAAEDNAWQARQWGCDKPFLLSVLLASARHSLGRASFAAGRTEQAAQHFQRSLFEPGLQSEARRVARARTDDASAELDARRASAARQRKAGLKADELTAPAWINDLAARCLGAVDVHDAVDTVLDKVLATADDRVRFLMRLAVQYQLRNDTMTAVHFLNTARECSHGAHRELRIALAKQLVAAGHAGVATDMFVGEALDSAASEPSDDAFVQSLLGAYRASREAEQARHEHGHELLIAHLKLHLARLRPLAGGRKLSMVEIGTTRENVPGQGSTRKLAEFCKQHGISFVTVDMDEHNARMARLTFEGMSVDFEAVAMKGEEYLRQRQQSVDFVFLDAYDFDHGKHSELRQSRYLKYLGSRIDEQACHQMHLDCAQSLARLLSPYGVVCMDDTWLDGGRWTAKGTLAMPYLLDNGFELVDARNRAALLKRAAAPAQPGAIA